MSACQPDVGYTSQQETETDADISEHVVLTMYCIGDEGGKYAQEHLDELNKILTEKINAEIDPVMISWGDYSKKLPMLWENGDPYDLTYTSNWTGYFKAADKGAFKEITDLFPEYAPKTYEEYVEKDLLETTKVNGKLYMVPSDYLNFTTFIYNYREDLRKKYNCPEIVDMESFQKYLEVIRENEPDMIPYSNNGIDAKRYQMFLNENDWSRPLEDGNGIFVYDLNDPTKIFNVVETPEYEAFIEESREYYEKGYWSSDILTETNDLMEIFVAGKSATFLGNLNSCEVIYNDCVTKHPDWEIGLFSSDLASGYVEAAANTNDGIAIGTYSRNPERAMMFIELCHQDEEVYNILINGIEGVTYEKDDETRTKWSLEGSQGEDIILKNLGMGLEDSKYELSSRDESPLVNEMIKKYEKAALVPELSAFTMDQSQIYPKIIEVGKVCAEYKAPLEKGTSDPKTELEEFRRSLKEAGTDAVVDEANRQIAEYLAQ